MGLRCFLPKIDWFRFCSLRVNINWTCCPKLPGPAKTSRRSDTKKEEPETKDEIDEAGSVKEDPESDADSDDKDEAKDEADVRDIRYKLETLP